MGVSSFAYQGSNAHALVAATEAGSDSREESGAWRRRRCWFTAASPNRLVERALRAPRGGVALLQVQLGGASGAEVHFRTVRGRRAVSESALVEAASAGLRSLGPQAREAALAEVTLAPVLGAEAGVLGLRLDLECGAVEVGEGELAGRCVVCSPGVQPSAGKAAAPLWGFGAAQRSSSAARLEVSQGAGGGYGTHPALLEGALQLSEGGLPAALEAFLSSARPVRAARARAGRGARGAWDLALRGSDGAVCVRGLVHRGVQALGGRRGAWDAAASTHLYEVAWEATRPEGRAEPAPELRMADALAGRMPGAAATLLQVVQVAAAGSSRTGVVLFAPAPAAGARGAAGHGAKEAALGAAGAALGGMLRSVALEIPGMQLACLDPGRGGPVGVGLGPAHAVEADVFGAAAAGGARMVPQLGPSAAVDAVAPAMPGKPGLAFAVTGGLGGLGLLMADALAHQAASQVVLTGRSGRAGASGSLRGLCGRRGGGPSVVLVRCDASASDERAACFGTAARVEAQPGCGRLGGVLPSGRELIDRLRSMTQDYA